MRIPNMTQVTARVCHEAGQPPPRGLVFDEDLGKYVPEHPEMIPDP